MTELETQLLTLIPGEATTDQFAEILSRVKFLKQQAAELDARLKSMLIEHIEVVGPITIGDTLYTVGTPAKYSSRDNSETLDSLIEFEGGDIAATAEKYLSSEPFKPGSIRTALGDDKFNELFETTRTPKLIEGKPVKQLMEINKAFVKGGAGT